MGFMLLNPGRQGLMDRRHGKLLWSKIYDPKTGILPFAERKAIGFIGLPAAALPEGFAFPPAEQWLAHTVGGEEDCIMRVVVAQRFAHQPTRNHPYSNEQEPANEGDSNNCGASPKTTLGHHRIPPWIFSRR